MSHRPTSCPSISVLVPIHNGERYVDALFRSLRAQTFTSFEILLLDDGSTDGTALAIDRLREDDRVRLLSFPTRRGLGHGLAALLGAARGEFWCSPGVDDVLDPECLERRLAQLARRKDVAIAHGRPRFIDSDGAALADPWGLPCLPDSLDGAEALALLLHHNVVIQPSALIRTSWTRRIEHLFSGDWFYAPDWLFWLLHASAGGALLYDDRPVISYRIHGRSLTRSPELQGIRAMEVGLVPLHALHVGATLSDAAMRLWARWREALYLRFLQRAAMFRGHPAFATYMQRAAACYYGAGSPVATADAEYARAAGAMSAQAAEEARLLERHRFRGTGLVLIDHPFFRSG